MSKRGRRRFESRPTAYTRESGYRSLPVFFGGGESGVILAYRTRERPWEDDLMSAFLPPLRLALGPRDFLSFVFAIGALLFLALLDRRPVWRHTALLNRLRERRFRGLRRLWLLRLGHCYFSPFLEGGGAGGFSGVTRPKVLGSLRTIFCGSLLAIVALLLVLITTKTTSSAMPTTHPIKAR